ncbi:MAG TPA: asparagine synthase-related protein [Pirellulales bacterium]|nr:asparagine synthase-related protein [Pirellulales bacterium]
MGSRPGRTARSPCTCTKSSAAAVWSGSAASSPSSSGTALYLWAKVVLPNYVLAFLGDRMEMAHSIEGRLPFLDHHVVELARDLPLDQKIRRTVEKHVLREAARPVLSATVYARQKHPFTTPPAALNPDGRLYQLMQDTLRGPTLDALPFFDRSRVVALLDQLPTMDDGLRTAYDMPLMVLLSTCVIQERIVSPV